MKGYKYSNRAKKKGWKTRSSGLGFPDPHVMFNSAITILTSFLARKTMKGKK